MANEPYLIQLARQGSSAACSELFDRYYDAIFRYCYYHVCNVELAQDLTNEVFTRMVEHLETIDESGRPLLTWLYGIAGSVIRLSLDEPHLIQLARQGDATACSRLYDRYYDAIYRYCYYYVGDAAQAQDLTGQVFVQMAQELVHFQNRDRTLLAWLYTIARRLLANFYRLKGQATPSSLEDTLALRPDNLNGVERHLSAENLAVALSHLAEQDRQVILLQFVEAHSCAEAARLMGQSEETFQAQPHRALAALQRVFQEYPAYGQ